MTLTNTEPAAVAKRALDTYRELLASGHTDGYARAVSIGTVVVEANKACAEAAHEKSDITEAITLICAAYASHYQNSKDEIVALADTQQELSGVLSFEVAGVLGKTQKPEVDFLPPNRDERDWERGGFALGKASWQGRL